MTIFDVTNTFSGNPMFHCWCGWSGNHWSYNMHQKQMHWEEAMTMHRVKLPEGMMVDNKPIQRFHASRWPSLDRAVVSADPRKEMPEPDTIVDIDGVRYRVIKASPMMQIDLTVEEVK